jgi:hypothetical protein
MNNIYITSDNFRKYFFIEKLINYNENQYTTVFMEFEDLIHNIDNSIEDDQLNIDTIVKIIKPKLLYYEN